MKTKLVSITKPLVEGINTPEEFITYCARVSNPTNQLNMETSDRLIAYLMKHKHWSPFEMVNVCVEIQTSRAIAAQILRHRSFSFQEFSQRYSKATELEPIEIRQQAVKNRQSSTDIFDPVLEHTDFGEVRYTSEIINDYLKGGQWLYENLIKQGVAKESARMVLPLTTQTTMYMNGSLRSWIHYLDIRCDEHTQKEHREIALSIKELLEPEFPNVFKALVND